MINTGQKLPQGHFKHMTPEGLKTLTTDDLCAGKRVVLFAVPGAFTPTCSAQHLPGFVSLFDAIKQHDVDTIACIAVNDAFVLQAWAQSQQADAIMMLSDGNAEFTEAIGMVLDGSGHGMGKRSQRYAMIVDDGVVVHLAIDAPGSFESSRAERILHHLEELARS